MTSFCIAFSVFFLWYGIGIAIGYHRLLSHRAYKCKKIFEYFWVLGGYLAYQGSPIWWTAMHRAHHKHVDTELDPHSPGFGLWRGYAGWIWPHTRAYPPHIKPQLQCKDIYADRLYKFLEQDGSFRRATTVNLLTAFIFHSTTSLIFGWQIGLAGLVASLVMFQLPLIVNTCCHIPRLGYKRFPSADDSVNVWWLGILAVGEGWHNNHHAYPGLARAGLRPYEFDLSWCVLLVGKFFGLVTHLNAPVVRHRRRRAGLHVRFKRRQRMRMANRVLVSDEMAK